MARDDETRLRGEDQRSHEIDCERCEPLLSSYLLEELPAVEREQVGSHLGGCGKCRDELDLLRATAEALAKSPPPGDLSGGVEREPILRKARTFQRRPTPLWWASAAAAALVVAGTSLAIYRAGRWQMESGEGEVVRRDAVGAPEAPVVRDRARAELERTLESAPVQTASGPAPAQPARPGTTGEGAEKAGVALTEAADASSWPILAKTNEDGAASVSESRALTRPSSLEVLGVQESEARETAKSQEAGIA